MSKTSITTSTFSIRNIVKMIKIDKLLRLPKNELISGMVRCLNGAI